MLHSNPVPLARNLGLTSIGDHDNADAMLERAILSQQHGEDRCRLQVLNLVGQTHHTAQAAGEHRVHQLLYAEKSSRT